MTRCFEPREIAAALDLVEGDAGRRHLDTCPRCRSLALAYYEFMESPDAKDVEFSAADSDLQRRLATAFTGRTGEQRPWWRVEWPKPVWASAAVALTAAAVLLLWGDFGGSGGDLPPGRGSLRGEDPGTGLLVEVGPTGLTASWPEPADADADLAVIIFYDETMTRDRPHRHGRPPAGGGAGRSAGAGGLLPAAAPGRRRHRGPQRAGGSPTRAGVRHAPADGSRRPAGGAHRPGLRSIRAGRARFS